MSPKRVAAIGAGIFAREQHLPAIHASKDSLQLVAVYSHTKASTDTYVKEAQKFNYEKLDQYYDVDNNTPVADKGLDALLARTDIDAVTIALTILTQPDVIRKCLKAGKHVLCEKPIAKTVADGEKLVHDYYEIRKSNPNLIFSIAENWRYEAALLYAAEVVKSEKIGKLRFFSLSIMNDTNEENKYYNTAWRKDPQYQGGFLLDGGVHYAAALRLIVGVPIDSVSSFGRLNKEYLAPIDTVHATIKLADGTTGTFAASFASPLNLRNITVVGSKGHVVIEGVDNTYKVTVTVDGKAEEKKFTYEGVKNEIHAFGQAIVSGKAEPLASSVEAVLDVALIETIINSSDQQGKVVKFPSLSI